MIKLQPNIIDWMREFSGLLILLPNFNSFVTLSSDKSYTRMIESRSEYSSFCRDGTRLYFALDLLEIVSRFPIPEMQASIVRTYFP